MKCRCGYEGFAELGDFPDDRKYSRPGDRINFRCPKCKTTKNYWYVDEYDSFRLVLFYPEKGQRLHIGGRLSLEPDTVSWGEDRDRWGSGGTISLEDYNKIREEAVLRGVKPPPELPPPTLTQVQTSVKIWETFFGKKITIDPRRYEK